MLIHFVIGLVVGFVFWTFALIESIFSAISIGVLFSFWPDFDSIIHFLILWWKHGSFAKAKNLAIGKWAHEHRNILHIPLLILPAAVLISFSSGPTLAIAFVLLSIAHFCIDSIGIGWGVRWFYPFSSRNFKWKNGGIRSWSPEELKAEVEISGDPNWLRRPKNWA